MSKGRLRRNDYYEAAVAILNEYGLPFREQTGRKHGKLYVTVNGAERLVTLSGSPSDRRGILNFRAEMKRNIRQWKAETEGLVATSVSAQLPTLEKEAMDDSIGMAEPSTDVIEVLGRQITKVEYKGQRVVTLRQIDEAHEKANGQARKQFNGHRERFIEGVDYIELNQPSEIRTLGFSRPQGGTPASVLLFTERGYGKIVKGWNDDLSWSLHDAMQDAYFLVKGAQVLSPDDVDALAMVADLERAIVEVGRKVDALATVPVLRQQLWGAIQWEDQQFRAALNETVRAVLGGQKKVLANPDTWRKAGVLPVPHGEDHEFCTTYELLCLVIDADRIHPRLTTWVTNEVLMPAARDGLWPQGRTPVRSRSDRSLVTFPLVKAREHLQRKDVRKAVLAKNEGLWRDGKGGVVVDMFGARQPK